MSKAGWNCNFYQFSLFQRLQIFPLYRFSVSIRCLPSGSNQTGPLDTGGRWSSRSGWKRTQRGPCQSHRTQKTEEKQVPCKSSQADGFLRIMTRWHLQNEQAIRLTDSPWPARGMLRCPITLPLFFPPGFTQKPEKEKKSCLMERRGVKEVLNKH